MGAENHGIGSPLPGRRICAARREFETLAIQVALHRALGRTDDAVLQWIRSQTGFFSRLDGFARIAPQAGIAIESDGYLPPYVFAEAVAEAADALDPAALWAEWKRRLDLLESDPSLIRSSDRF